VPQAAESPEYKQMLAEHEQKLKDYVFGKRAENDSLLKVPILHSHKIVELYAPSCDAKWIV
jgi:hypothetical protein